MATSCWGDDVTAPDLDRLAGECIVLRPIEPAHVAELYAISMSDANGFRWRFRGAVPSLAQFEAELFTSAFHQFAVLERATGDLVGHVVAYNHDPVNGHCSVAVLVKESSIGARLGRDALDTFVRFLFRLSPLRKIYAEVPGGTVEGVEPSAAENGFGSRFAIEGRLTDHWFVDGGYQDMVIVAMARAAWEN